MPAGATERHDGNQVVALLFGVRAFGCHGAAGAAGTRVKRGPEFLQRGAHAKFGEGEPGGGWRGKFE